MRPLHKLPIQLLHHLFMFDIRPIKASDQNHPDWFLQKVFYVKKSTNKERFQAKSQREYLLMPRQTQLTNLEM